MNKVKKCLVCGDQASGFNYDGLSCESCKVFFCRNADKVEILKCKFIGICDISSISTRTQCPKCRLIKCFSIGMKKRKCSNMEICNTTETHSGVEQILEISILKYVSDYDLKNISKYLTTQKDIQRKRIPFELNHFELEQISEAQNAIRVFANEYNVPQRKQATDRSDLVELPMLYIKKSINFCQHFAAFNSLKNEDQMLVLKPFSVDLLSIWFAFQADRANDGIHVFTDDSETETIFISNDLAMNHYKDKVLLRKMLKKSYMFQDAMENDGIIRDLLLAVYLFKHSQNLSSPENSRYHYHLYSMLLLRYLQQKCQSKKMGNRKYVSLLRLIDHLEQFKRLKIEFAIEFGAEKLPPVIKELFNLN